MEFSASHVYSTVQDLDQTDQIIGEKTKHIYCFWVLPLSWVALGSTFEPDVQDQLLSKIIAQFD